MHLDASDRTHQTSTLPPTRPADRRKANDGFGGMKSASQGKA